MKFFVAFVAFVAVAAAFPSKPTYSDDAQLEAIIAAINSPNTDPATAILLEEQLQEILNPHPIAVGPEIVDFPVPDGGAVSTPVDVHPISIGPEIVDFPLPDGGAVTAPVAPSPVVIGPVAPGAPAPLVQLIVNVNAGVGIGGVAAAEAPSSPINIVDVADNSAVNPIIPEPVDIAPIEIVDVMPVVVDPVQVVDVSPIVIEPVQVGTPVFPSPAVTLPEELN